ncbi:MULTISPECIES: CotO family spore coat protein [Heyndrickxia]|uniref:CotO family spore coat protein n=1 Tax=Heyndrickxia TaxID=2837504 RepID=UPI002DBC9E4B|nr:CotO family spore coat protein [Weizmannia sp. CD-2023]MEC2306623.1 CotO family spore coat protein [Weizmannia sp. CD-2023]MEC2342328.1 CotO family spore coat protein [Weizmannia sp. CD-2023]
MEESQYSSQKPLLYIIQPKNVPLAIKMQKVYRNVVSEKPEHAGHGTIAEPMPAGGDKGHAEEKNNAAVQEEKAEPGQPIPNKAAEQEKTEGAAERGGAVKVPAMAKAADTPEHEGAENAAEQQQAANAVEPAGEVDLETDSAGTTGTLPEQETFQPPTRKRFKEMTVHEKIDYLIHKPRFLPEIPVMIQTNSTAYRAVILERMEDQLSVMPFSSMETAWINLDEITDIKLLVQ